MKKSGDKKEMRVLLRKFNIQMTEINKKKKKIQEEFLKK